jgi:hypothetical protein
MSSVICFPPRFPIYLYKRQSYTLQDVIVMNDLDYYNILGSSIGQII